MSSAGPMQKHRAITLERLEKFHSAHEWADVNLRSMLYASRAPVTQVEVWSAPGLERPPFAVVLRQAKFQPFDRASTRFGPSWSTHWFRLRLQIPQEWPGEVHLLWDATCECCVFRDGQPVQGLLGGSGRDRRAQYPLSGVAPGDSLELYIELAANGMFGVGRGGDINPVDPDKSYQLLQCELGLLRKEAWDLMWDFIVIAEMAKELPETDPAGSQALYAANAIQNAVWTDDPLTIPRGRAIAADFFQKHRNSPDAFTVSAVGNVHIDTAWLWPYAETRRKVVRSFASQLALLDRYPHHRFVASQAQQFAWLREDQPKLFQRFRDAVSSRRFFVVGGTWVEMDCNLPSGESFCRQFLVGQRFFRKEFGHYCEEFWLPDTFGYSSQLPQIIRQSGIKYFLTQKLSWNLINKFPHHTFLWEGIDGSTVLTHFPPADTYCANVTVKEILYSQTNFKDRERSSDVMMLFGHGDGGGGPDAPMLERLQRCGNLQGLPTVETRAPIDFFKRVEARSAPLLRWSGELYFELHRGTYTTQALIKRQNRKCELLLREVELWSAANLPSEKYPRESLEELWKLVLLNQFHDVLPGSCIGAVADDAHAHHALVLESAKHLLEVALSESEMEGGSAKRSRSSSSPAAEKQHRIYNSLPWMRKQVQKDGTVLKVPAFSFSYEGSGESLESAGIAPVRGFKQGTDVVLENDHLRAVVSSRGRLLSLIHRASGRESILNGDGNVFCLFDDVNLFWDAWDAETFHLEKRNNLMDSSVDVSLLEPGVDCVQVRVNIQLTSRSRLEQVIVLRAGAVRLDFQTTVQWNENRKFLKVEFATTVLRTAQATFETQFGHLQRPTHRNTSWDWAKFEVCAHRWCDLSEYGFGVALLNDCKYGHAVEANVMRLSLLRSPKAPDDKCDVGMHHFTYSLMPHSDSFQRARVIEEAYELNIPLLKSPTAVSVAPSPPSLFEIAPGSEAVILETVKLAEEGGSDIIIRLYEAYGSTCRFQLKSLGFPFQAVSVVNILEEPMSQEDAACYQLQTDAVASVISGLMTPFKLLTLRLKCASK